jgi:hypothetical protein
MAKKAKKVPFDPKVFLATANGGRSLSKYRKNKVIYSRGEPADFGVLYLKGSGQGHCRFRAREGSRRCGLGSRRILRRGVPDRTAAAPGYGRCNDRVRDRAAGEGGHRPCST